MAKSIENKRDGVGGGAASVQNREQMQRINFLHQAAILVASAGKSKVKRTTAKKQRPVEKPQDAQGREARKEAVEARLMSMLARPQQSAPVGWASPPVTTARMAAEMKKAKAALTKKGKARKARKAANTLSIGKIHSRSTILGKTQEEGNLPAPDKSLSSVYVKDIRSIARKSVMRIDPNVKRTLCRNCNAVLIPGVTSSVRVKPSGAHVHRIRTTCLACGVHRVIPCPPLRGENGWVEEEKPIAQGQGGREMPVDDTQDGKAAESAENVMDEDAPTETEAERAGTDDMPADKTAKASHKKKKSSNTKKSRRKRNLDDLVPGTRKQYSHPRFNEKKEHVLYRGYEKA